MAWLSDFPSFGWRTEGFFNHLMDSCHPQPQDFEDPALNLTPPFLPGIQAAMSASLRSWSTGVFSACSTSSLKDCAYVPAVNLKSWAPFHGRHKTSWFRTLPTDMDLHPDVLWGSPFS